MALDIGKDYEWAIEWPTFFPGNAYYVLPRIASYVFLGIRRLSGVWDRWDEVRARDPNNKDDDGKLKN